MKILKELNMQVNYTKTDIIKLKVKLANLRTNSHFYIELENMFL